MSLTSFLQCEDVRERFASQFPRPKIKPAGSLRASPLSKRYMPVGTAFDYLFRFYLQRLNPGSIQRSWVAENAIKRMITTDWEELWSEEEAEGVLILDREQTLIKALQIVSKAKRRLASYLSLGRMTDALAESCLALAQLDAVVRPGYLDGQMGKVYQSDIRDLRQLIRLARPQAFKAKHLCVLNPTFGDGSFLVGGADGDIILDDTLIEVKTTKTLCFASHYFHQLLGYYILSIIGGIDGLGFRRIRNLGIYYSRQGVFLKIPIRSAIDEKKLPAFIRWFEKRARAEIF